MRDWFTNIADGELLDFRVGEALYLENYWKKQTTTWKESLSYGMKYPYGVGDVQRKIETKLHKIHSHVGNAFTKDKILVIGNGATQLLQAALYAQAKSLNKEDLKVWYRKPYWPRFHTLLKFVGLGLTYSESDPDIEICVAPNNPDNKVNGRTFGKFFTKQVWDFCYNWPQYCDPVHENEEIMIFSLAKATGHAGVRFGWAWVKDKQTADAMRHFIELTTSGVSDATQRKTLAIFGNIIDNKYKIFDDGKKVLTERWARFSKATSKYDIVLHNSRGMFAWCSTPNHLGGVQYFQKLTKAITVGGGAFGELDSYFRVSLGVSNKQFTQLIKNLSNEKRSTNKS